MPSKRRRSRSHQRAQAGLARHEGSLLARARGRPHVRNAFLVRSVRSARSAPPARNRNARAVLCARGRSVSALGQSQRSIFVAATRSGDLDGLMQMLTADVRVVNDGGGKATAALNVLEGVA